MPTRREFLAASLAAGALRAERGELTDLTLQQASEMIRKKSVSPVELTRACLERIERLNPTLNAFITVTAEQALAQARVLEAEQRGGHWRGPLHGIPIALKDLFDTAGVRTTAASAVFADRVPGEDAEVVRRLKAVGAISLGKLNMHEFAYGDTSVPTHYGAVHNPWKLDHIAGGSSGGSGAAVAAGLCYGALGSDTGGSIREPAAFCSIVGLKPTYGRVSTRGVIPLSWSLDHVGPMCRTVADTALLLQPIAGYDPQDITSVDAPVPDYAAALRAKTTSLRLGIPRAIFYEQLHSEIEAAVTKALEVLRRLTAGLRDVEMPPLQTLPIVGAEAYAFHAPYLSKTPELYQSPTRQRLERGSQVTTAAYVQARRDLDRLRRAVGSVFVGVDLLVTPTTPIPPLTIEEAPRADMAPPGVNSLLRNTRPFDIYGLPTISVPCGFTRAGLPIGLQISGPRFGEGKVLALAHAYEQATDWHQRRPATML